MSPRQAKAAPLEHVGESFQIVIVGRPNVGKSTLFNRLYGRRRALVHDLPGVTRDRLIEETQWTVSIAPEAGSSATRAYVARVKLVDTGGVGETPFAEQIAAQVASALEGADVVVWVVDGQVGIHPEDRLLGDRLRTYGVMSRCPVILAVNKVDDEQHEAWVSEFYELGVEDVLGVSAEHALGTDELKELAIERALELRARARHGATPAASAVDDLASHETTSAGESAPGEELVTEAALATEETLDDAPRFERGPPKIAVVGRPNVGKSTLVNHLLGCTPGAERMIVSPVAGTTIDSIDSEIQIDGSPYVIIDTAGIRRKSKTEQGVEVLSVVQTRKALERCDIAILVLDASMGITDQDEKIGGLIEEVGSSVILLVNKWDTTRSNPELRGLKQDEAARQIRDKMAYLRYAPIVFASAARGEGLSKLGGLIQEVLKQRTLKVATHEFTEWVRRAVPIHNPKGARFYLCHQAGRHPPTFVCHVNDARKVHFSLRRHLVNGIRERWGYMGSPVRLVIVSGAQAGASH